MKTKYHTTVKITRKKLLKLDACEFGLQQVRSLLPAKISTDPHENFELAEALICASASWRLHWLARKVSDYTFEIDAQAAYSVAGRSFFADHDGWQVAQQLAAIADYIATKEGR